MAKKAGDIRKILLVILIILILFGPRQISEGKAASIARDALLHDQILATLQGRVTIDLIDVKSEGSYWRVHAKIICRRNAESICAPSSLSERGIAADYTVLVDKSTGNAVIVYPYYGTQA